MSKGKGKTTLSADGDRHQRIRDLVGRLLGLSPRNALAFIPTLDISRPNIHDSKAEFLAELETVRGALDQLGLAFDKLAPFPEENRPRMKIVDRLMVAVDQSARQRLSGLFPASATELIRKNNVDNGLYLTSLRVIADLILELEVRKKELQAQEKEFWSVKNRPPRYYARTIALRLARLYAAEKGEKPTSGVARDGGHPSTEFGRALEEVFAILDIDADVRRAAEWAISELTHDDLAPRGGRIGALLGVSSAALQGIPQDVLKGFRPEG
jgi:hypothetical protein